MGPLEGVLSPLVEEPPPRREGLSLLALLGGFLDALMVAACTIVLQSLATHAELVTVLFKVEESRWVKTDAELMVLADVLRLQRWTDARV